MEIQPDYRFRDHDAISRAYVRTFMVMYHARARSMPEAMISGFYHELSTVLVSNSSNLLKSFKALCSVTYLTIQTHYLVKQSLDQRPPGGGAIIR